ncbi:MAG TPA: hypothetical protein VF530_21670 [Planctomycetota bacterium]
MSSLLELRCPGCAHVLSVPRARTAVGRPFEDCPRCRAPVERPGASEWDLLGSGRRWLWVLDRIAPFLVLGLLPGVAYAWFVQRPGQGEPYVLGALLAGGPLLAATWPVWRVRVAIRRSRARMADPMYRARLIELGRRATIR